MMKKLLLTLSWCLLSPICMYAQAAESQESLHAAPPALQPPAAPETRSQPARPSSPTKLTNYGSLMFDWGFDFLQDAPTAMKPGFWGSRMNNIYFYYNIRILRSYFTISPGIGWSNEGYQFQEHEKDYYTLVRDQSSRNTALKAAKEIVKDSSKILSSCLGTSYVDFVLETRFNANRQYPKEGFFMAIGGKLRLLWGASTTVEYEEDNQKKKRTIVESFNLKRFCYGVHARLGWSRFSIFYGYPLSPLFSEGKGPDKTKTRAHSAGLSVDLF